MGSKSCTNEACRAVTSSEWKKGWSLKSGGSASLCYNCGSAYENSIFCETFHSEDSGWRACRSCGKMVHCGCIASRHLHEYMDSGGVTCISCAKRMEIQSAQAMQIPSDIRNGTFVPKSVPENRTDVDRFSTERLLQLTKSIGVNDITSAFEPVLKTPESSIIKHLANTSLHPSSSSAFSNSDNNNSNSRTKQGFKNVSESLPQPSLNFSMTTTPPLASSSTMPPFPVGIFEGGEQSKGSTLQRTRHVIVKPPKPISVVGPELSRGSSLQPRVPRPPPPEGRGRSQLLPRYWPRITDKELQKLSGDLNSTIVPLFEKVLSASDAGRIGRLVLPKACAEAYFPTINQSEGIPIRIQDIKGKEWTFQFRFWPNNNSRMYVLEGVTPCIQSMQVQAGDTVIFSRRDPEGQLVIGCRKAASLTNVQEPQTPALTNGDPLENTSYGAIDNLPMNGGRGSDDYHKQHMSLSEKKKARNIKNKRLHMHNEDALELRITWEEAQELLRPSPSSEPTVFMVEDHEFEEFSEPPVFGKRTIFISQPSGEQEQVAQCDSCSKWRRLPVHALISANWTCPENVWDTIRSSCSAPEDINLTDPDFLKTNKEYKKQRSSEGKVAEPSGLDALANAAVLGDITELSSVATTRHPRHRPGCTCIVCIQPPSGKGKHEATCKCNVCLTVRRRFRTLMLRKKRRQSERETEVVQDGNSKDKTREVVVGRLPLETSIRMDEMRKNEGGNKEVVVVDSKGDLDLNSDPRREGGISGVSSTPVMDVNGGGFPVDVCVQPPPTSGGDGKQEENGV